MSHILAVSGMHISYLILGVNCLFKSVLGKKIAQVITIIVLLFYSGIIGFSASITRAVIMGIMVILSKLIHRKNDIYTSIALSLIVILLYNPYSILKVGLQLSYGGTLGILLFNKTISKLFNLKSLYKKENKIIEKLKDILSVTFSAQIIILPIILFHFNSLGIYFIITNILVSFIIGPIILLGFLFIISTFINDLLSKSFAFVLSFGIKILIQISNISKLPFAKIYVPTIKIWQMIIYILIVFTCKRLYLLYKKKNINMTERRLKNLIAFFKYKSCKNKKKILVLLLIFILIVSSIKFFSRDLKIYFIDVGQGDSSLIATPQDNTILIDGGGSISSSFDVGKQIVIPYLLDRGFSKLDYIFISHFDQDHVRSDC